MTEYNALLIEYNLKAEAYLIMAQKNLFYEKWGKYFKIGAPGFELQSMDSTKLSANGCYLSAQAYWKVGECGDDDYIDRDRPSLIDLQTGEFVYLAIGNELGYSIMSVMNDDTLLYKPTVGGSHIY